MIYFIFKYLPKVGCVWLCCWAGVFSINSNTAPFSYFVNGKVCFMKNVGS